MEPGEVKRLMEAAYLAGFNASGEGYNGEYPFQDKDRNPEDEEDWREARDEALAELMDTGTEPRPSSVE